ncbi:unnamed protein product [Caretta caretta]
MPLMWIKPRGEKGEVALEKAPGASLAAATGVATFAASPLGMTVSYQSVGSVPCLRILQWQEAMYCNTAFLDILQKLPVQDMAPYQLPEESAAVTDAKGHSETQLACAFRASKGEAGQAALET